MKPHQTGRIVLVGAGPGDPELLTLKAVRALESADLVLYDALVDARVLSLASRARRFYVGKRAGRHALAQETTNALLVRAAKRGLTVVRLKAGDPFVFGRGGEEAIFARARGIDVTIVPGISSAFAAPLAAGIPVTHREVSRGVLVLTASPDDTWKHVLPSLAHADVTVVLMMALGSREKIRHFLLAHGWDASHPAAIVCGATTPDEWAWSGTLDELARADVPEGPPGIVVLGAAVRLSPRIVGVDQTAFVGAAEPRAREGKHIA